MSDVVLQMRGVTRTYPRFTLGPMDLDVRDGAIVGLVGPNGAGKSTLLRLLVGLVRPDAGTISVFGHAMPAEERLIKSFTGFVSEDMSLYASASLRWHMQLVARVHRGWDDEWALAWARRLDLDVDQPAGGLSRGQQVKAQLLLALGRRPAMLLLDEPTTGLDPIARREVMQLLADTHASRRVTLFSSHQSDDVEGLADEVLFLHRGRIIARGPTSQFVTAGRTLEAAFLAHVDAQQAEEVA
jgi:ABC-2 type transport system ATP-binding protein